MSLQLPRPARLTGGLAAAALLFGVVACGDDSGTTENTAATEAEVTTGADSTSAACDLLSFEEIEDATGTMPATTSTGITASPAGESRCFWEDGDDRSIMSLARWSSPADLDEVWDDHTSGLFADNDGPDPEVGDDAMFWLAGPNSLGGIVFRTGDAVYLISLSNRTETKPATPEMEAEARPQLVDLAEDVLDS